MKENKQYIEPEYRDNDNQDNESFIDWLAVLRKIIAIRKTLYKAAGVGLVIGIIIAFSVPKQYTVTVTLSPEMGTEGKAGGGLASLASSFLGGGADIGSMDALNATLSSEIVASTPFVLELFDIRVQDLDEKIDTTLVAYLDMQRIPWWNYILKAPRMVVDGIKGLFKEEKDNIKSNQYLIQLTAEEYEKYETLKQLIIADVDTKTAITTISVTFQDPKVSAIVADSVVHKLQEYIIKYRSAKAKDDCAYLEQLYKERQREYYAAQEKYANYVDANKSIVFQSIRTEQERLQNDMNLAFQVYSQVAQQLEVSRAKIQEAKPVFAVVEPASIPLQPSGVSKKVIIIGFIFLSICLTAIWHLIGKDYWRNSKKFIHEEMK